MTVPMGTMVIMIHICVCRNVILVRTITQTIRQAIVRHYAHWVHSVLIHQLLILYHHVSMTVHLTRMHVILIVSV